MFVVPSFNSPLTDLDLVSFARQEEGTTMGTSSAYEARTPGMLVVATLVRWPVALMVIRYLMTAAVFGKSSETFTPASSTGKGVEPLSATGLPSRVVLLGT